jgi:hypothetical protein
MTGSCPCSESDIHRSGSAPGVTLQASGRQASPASSPAPSVVRASFRCRAGRQARPALPIRVHLDAILGPTSVPTDPYLTFRIAAAAAAMLPGYFTSRSIRSLCTPRGWLEIKPSPRCSPSRYTCSRHSSVTSCLQPASRAVECGTAPLSQSDTVRSGMPSCFETSVAFAPASVSSGARARCSPNAPSTPMRLRGLEPPRP